MTRAESGLASVILFATVLFCSSSWSQAAVAQETPANYIVLQGGMSNPLGDLKDAKFERGATLALFYGRHLHPNFALETGVQPFHAEGGEADSIVKATYWDRDVISWAIPLTAKGVYRDGILSLAAGAGVDLILTNLEFSLRVPGSETVKEKTTAFGFHFSGDIGFNLSRMLYLGLQGKYLSAPSVKFGEDAPAVDVSAWMLMLAIGVRF